MKTKPQTSGTANLPSGNHTEASQPLKEMSRSAVETGNTSYLAESKQPLRTTDMNLLKDYSQFFIELS